MPSLFASSVFPIGIDAGTQAVRLLQFKRAGGGGSEAQPGAFALALQGACRVDLDEGAIGPQSLAAAVQKALAAGGFKGRKVVLSLPASTVAAKSVRLPPMPDSDVSQALQWEAKDRFGFEVSNSAGGSAGQLVWFRSGEVRRGTEVKEELLLFAVNGEALSGYVQAISALGLQIAGIDLACCAAYRSIQRSTPAMSAGVGALLDLGHLASQFSITRDGELVFYKQIEIGGKTILDAIASKLGITVAEAAQMRSRIAADSSAADEAAPLHQALHDALRAPLEELAREIDMCMRYFVVTFRGLRPETIGLAGRQACCPQTREILSAALGLQVDESQVLRGVQELGGAARPDRSSEWAVAAGLSLYPLGLLRRTEAA